MGDVTKDDNFRQCPRCRYQNTVDNAFCYNCGYSLTAPLAEAPIQEKKWRKGPIIAASSVLFVLLVAAVMLIGLPAIRESQLAERYAAAIALLEKEDYAAAEQEFLSLEDYEDAPQQAAISRDYLDYQDAVALMESNDFEGAMEGFEVLGTFEDSTVLAEECRNNINYATTLALMESGQYEDAYTEFYALGSFEDSTLLAEECLDIIDYEIAEESFNAGRYYDAWKEFSALGDYQDSAARAENCRQPYPENGESYHSEDFSGGTTLTISTDSGPMPTYIKVYTDSDELVSCVFLHTSAAVDIKLPSGTYRFKTATGEYWYGEEQLFGDEGYYQSLLFDGNNDTVYIDVGFGPYELTLGGVVDGNVGTQGIDPDDM